jgi:6-phosphogluconolactonase
MDKTMLVQGSKHMDMESQRRIILITGATSGLGCAMASALAGRRYDLILTCRDKAKGDRIACDLAARNPEAKFRIFELDLASFSSIESFSDLIMRTYERIDVLFNNAGLYNDVAARTAEGFEMTLGVNYIGAYYLTRRLLPLLSRGNQPQIIQMCSFAALLGSYRDRPDIFENHPHGYRAYLNSKTMQLMMTVHMADELKNEGIMVNAVQPGVVSTGLWKGRSFLMKMLSYRHQDRYSSASEAAEAGLALIENIDLRKETGGLYKAGGRRMRTGRRFRDRRWIGSLVSRTNEAIAKKTQMVYVGTYTEPGYGSQDLGKGIYIYRLDHGTGLMKPANLAMDVPNPSFLALSPSRRTLYAVNELTAADGRMCGAVCAFAVDKMSGALAFLNKMPTSGADPCHVTVNDGETHVFVTNYSSGSICVFPVREDGSLGERAQFIQHAGSGADPDRQESPHPHSSILDKQNRFLFVPDLGLDKIMIYQYDPAADQPLSPAKTPHIGCRPGAGPRHGAFHPSGKYFYVINELDCSICTYRYDSRDGRLLLRQSITARPAGYSSGGTGADIHISPDGRFLYGSVRGYDSIVQYKINQKNGKLAYVGHNPCGGKTPRNFAMDLSGDFLLAASQGTGNMTIFRVNPRTGELSETAGCDIPAPVCVKVVSFIP